MELKSTGLSFNAKANLLLDMQYFKKDDRWKLQKFMEIRNQFAHNLRVETFEQCFEIITGKEKIIKAYYKGTTAIAIEEKLKISVINLSKDIFELCEKAIQDWGKNYSREKVLEKLSLITITCITCLKSIPSWLNNDTSLSDFLLIFKEKLIKEMEYTTSSTPQEQNELIHKLIPNLDFGEMIQSEKLSDYFSKEDLEKHGIADDTAAIKLDL